MVQSISLRASLIVVGAAMVSLAFLAAVHTAPSRALVPNPEVDKPLAPTSNAGSAGSTETMVVAGGCFWGVQAVFEQVKGVISATSGYTGGARPADYEMVSTGRTGHAESVKVVYDPSRVSYGQLLKVFFSVVHDPTELNQQGPDVGTQYRSAIFYLDDAQRAVAHAYIDQLSTAKVFRRKIVTEVTPLTKFYEAEGYHQDYFFQHPLEPYIMINDRPKVEALKRQFPDLFVAHK
jgi:peptide-methionine (S)-S-oxide reductase